MSQNELVLLQVPSRCMIPVQITFSNLTAKQVRIALSQFANVSYCSSVSRGAYELPGGHDDRDITQLS